MSSIIRFFKLVNGKNHFNILTYKHFNILNNVLTLLQTYKS